MSPSEQVPIRKSPALAGFLSMMPGAGQVYVGHYVAGFTNIGIVGSIITLLESGVVSRAEPFFGLFLAFFWIFNIVDAVRRARLYNLRAMGAFEEAAPTDSPLVGGILLAIIGLVLTLTITFDIDLDWLENVWPLAVLGAGIYLIFRYRRAKDELEREARNRLAGPSHDRRHPAPPRPPASPHFDVASPHVSLTSSGGDEAAPERDPDGTGRDWAAAEDSRDRR